MSHCQSACGWRVGIPSDSTKVVSDICRVNQLSLAFSMFSRQVETALSQGIDPLTEGFSLILKKNGRIGARSKGCPPWGNLVGDVERRKEAGMDTSNI